MSVTAEQVQELRKETGAGIMECKKALAETGGDIKQAVAFLRKKGLSSLEKRQSRTANEGVIESYIHGAGRIGVMVEVNCETDFVARSDAFKEFAHEVAMQIAAASPIYVSSDDIPEDVINTERDIYLTQARNEDKPENVAEKIVQGRLNKFFEQVCLLDQGYIKDPDKKVKDLLGELSAKIGENIAVRRFVRYQLGESTAEE